MITSRTILSLPALALALASAGGFSACGSTSKSDSGAMDAGGDAGGADLGAADASVDGAVDGDRREVWPDLPMAPQPTVIADGLSSPCALALGGDGLVVAEDGKGRVVTMPVTGLGAGTTPRDLAPGLKGTGRIAVSGDDLIVAQHGAGRIMHAKNGTVDTLASGEVAPSRVHIAAGYAYWITEGMAASDGGVRRAPLAGGAAEDVATMVPSPRDLAVTKDRVYLTSNGARAVAAYALSGGGAAVASFVDKQGNSPQGIAVDEAAGEVYWTAPGPLPGGFVHRMTLGLTGDTLLSITAPGPSWVTLDSGFVYFSNNQSLARTPRGGGAFQDLAIETAACEFVLVDSAIVWTEPSTGRIYRLPLPTTQP